MGAKGVKMSDYHVLVHSLPLIITHRLAAQNPILVQMKLVHLIYLLWRTQYLQLLHIVVECVS